MKFYKFRINWPFWGSSDQKQTEVLGAVLISSNELVAADEVPASGAATIFKPDMKIVENQLISHPPQEAKPSIARDEGGTNPAQQGGEGEGSAFQRLQFRLNLKP